MSAMESEFSDVTIDLWNDTRITTEIQKPLAAGIQKYWFTNSEVDSDCICYAFEKAKNSWLSAKYIPNLNVTGQIDRSLKRYIGEFDLRSSLAKRFENIIKLCEQFDTAVDSIVSICNGSFSEAVDPLIEAKEELHLIKIESEKILRWLNDECLDRPTIDADPFYISFESIIESLNNSKISYTYHFHVSGIIRILNKLSAVDYYALLEEIESHLNQQCVLFLGNPGTGKSHGVSAFVDGLLEAHYHIPIIIQARSIPSEFNWRYIILNTLGLADTWSEDELWQALNSSANRNRFQDYYIQKEISICPKVIIIIDGIDESSTHERWIERIKETASITEKYPNIRFCFTSRPAVFSQPLDYANVIRLNDAGDVPVYKLCDIYTTTYSVSIQNCQWLKFALNTPLALKLFCEIYEGKSISISELSEVSMNQLWRRKIEMIQEEYNRKVAASTHNQSVFLAITTLSKLFVGEMFLEREEILASITKNVKVIYQIAEKILDHLEAYGIVGSFCKKGTGLSPDNYIYYAGIQGYFDYASAIYLLDEYKHPSLIDFEHCSQIDINTLYCLSIISIQQYQYLITRNPTIKRVTDVFTFSELQFYALQHLDTETAAQYKPRTLDIMRDGAENLVTIVNKLVLPLSRIQGHPLGVSVLDEFLNEFETPAQRDIVWSLPPYLRRSDGRKWYKDSPFAILYEDDEEYLLTADDLPDGLPMVYVWMLSNVSNPVRKKCRDRLMEWARMVPRQYYELFLHFADVNDPQIKSDLFSILMCLVYDGADIELIKEITDWVLSSILASSIIDQNRDISIRYYSIAIIEKAINLGLYAHEEVEESLPPYCVNNTEIILNKDALTGTRMRGYSAIDYDLARYVLVDHFYADFNTWHEKQLEKLVEEFCINHPDYEGITPEQFIISAAYAFVRQMGWNENDFFNYNKDDSGDFIGGPDCSIRASYHSADHGAQSEVMTVCEKYVWAARNYISGFLCDRLLFGDEQIKITDYNLVDDFSIPVQEMHQIDPDNIPDDRPWYIPEPLSICPNEEFVSKEALSRYVKSAPDIDWGKWINVDNSNFSYSVPYSKLLALNLYSCFYGLSGVETCLFINSMILPAVEVAPFIEAVHNKELFSRVCNPTDWYGGVESSCYITPKEVCWFPWKKHYNSRLTGEFPGLTIHSAVDRCCYNYPEYSDVYYDMPSALLRKLLGIVDTDGYLYFDKDNNIVSEYSIAGEKWRTTQEYVLLGRENTLQILEDSGLSLIWIMQEMRRETGNAKEKFGEFFAERRQYFIGYFKDEVFTVEKLIEEFTQSS